MQETTKMKTYITKSVIYLSIIIIAIYIVYNLYKKYKYEKLVSQLELCDDNNAHPGAIYLGYLFELADHAYGELLKTKPSATQLIKDLKESVENKEVQKALFLARLLKRLYPNHFNKEIYEMLLQNNQCVDDSNDRCILILRCIGESCLGAMQIKSENSKIFFNSQQFDFSTNLCNEILNDLSNKNVSNKFLIISFTKKLTNTLWKFKNSMENEKITPVIK